MKKIRYRIKIINYTNGRKEYYAQKKCFFGWRNLLCDGKVDVLGTAFFQDSREQSLERIDKHFAGNTSKEIVQFESIIK